MTSVGIAVVVDVTLVFVLNDIQFPELVVAVVVLNDGIRIDGVKHHYASAITLYLVFDPHQSSIHWRILAAFFRA